MKSILVADIGGTHSRFARFRRGGELELERSVWLDTQRARSLAELVSELRRSDLPLGQEEMVVLAVAGPVEGGIRARLPNVPWTIDLSRAEEDYGFRRFLLVNDFMAVSAAVLSPIRSQARKVLDGEVQSDAAMAVIGAGTGLGRAFLVPQGPMNFVPVASEGGHTNFPPASDREREFQRFAEGRAGGYVSWEDVLSGRGLTLVHEFLSGERLQPAEVARRFGDHPETLEWFARFFGRAARNLALEVVARGGVFVAGGVAAKNPQVVEHSAFAQEFRSPRTHEALLREIPVFLLTDESAGLWGAAVLGERELSQLS